MVCINILGVPHQYYRELRMLDYCYFSSWQQIATSGHPAHCEALGLNAGPHCLLLVVLLFAAIVSQGSLDGILCKH